MDKFIRLHGIDNRLELVNRDEIWSVQPCFDEDDEERVVGSTIYSRTDSELNTSVRESVEEIFALLNDMPITSNPSAFLQKDTDPYRYHK